MLLAEYAELSARGQIQLYVLLLCENKVISKKRSVSNLYSSFKIWDKRSLPFFSTVKYNDISLLLKNKVRKSLDSYIFEINAFQPHQSSTEINFN